jgi:hypothetical protein
MHNPIPRIIFATLRVASNYPGTQVAPLRLNLYAYTKIGHTNREVTTTDRPFIPLQRHYFSTHLGTSLMIRSRYKYLLALATSHHPPVPLFHCCAIGDLTCDSLCCYVTATIIKCYRQPKHKMLD